MSGSKSKSKKKNQNKNRIQKQKNEGLPSLVITILFTAVTILIVHGVRYRRDMSGYYWTSGADSFIDFFSYGKMIFILLLSACALVILTVMALSKEIREKRKSIYIPVGIYALCIIVSFLASDVKGVAGFGYNEQFEGTLVLLAYLIMFVFIINSITREDQIKAIILSVAVSSLILGLLGISQAAGHDFFQSAFGKRLITPVSMWDNLDTLIFNFQNNEIYQTVFNINYVSFYLAMLIPVCGVLFIYSANHLKKTKKSIGIFAATAALFALMLFNFAGSRSLGGAAGLAIAFIFALILFNKRLIKWWKSVISLLIVTVVMFAVTSSMWAPEISEYIKSPRVYAEEGTQDTESGSAENNGTSIHEGENNENADQKQEGQLQDASDPESGSLNEAGTKIPYIDYIKTDGYDVHFSINGEELIFTAVLSEENTLRDITVTDKDKNVLQTKETEESGRYEITDERFRDYITFRLVADSEENLYIDINTAGQRWPFLITSDGVKYRNGFGKLTELEETDAVGFKNNLAFGSGRGYIWSRTLAMIKDNILIGDGANTYCVKFPHNDYAGKYNSEVFRNNIDIVVDKPHNMYMGMFQGTGGISMICFLAIVLIYICGSIKTLINRTYSTWLEYAAAGIFLGITGFLTAGIFNDSNVSVMPMFYGLLAAGFAANRILEKQKA